MDDLYQGVIESFGRHRVRSWLVVGTVFGDKSTNPTFARREIDAVSPDASLKKLAAEEREHQQQLLASHASLYMQVTAIDADRWEVMRFSLWRNRSDAPQTESDCVQTYDVLHVSEG